MTAAVAPCEEPTLVERLRMECDFMRDCRPKVDDDSAIWLRLADLEELLDMVDPPAPKAVPVDLTGTLFEFLEEAAHAS